MKELIKQIFQDNTGQGSSKRLIVLWTGIPIWTFINLMAFLTEGMKEERSTLILYDFLMIVGGLGIVLGEKYLSNKAPDSK